MLAFQWSLLMNLTHQILLLISQVTAKINLFVKHEKEVFFHEEEAFLKSIQRFSLKVKV